MTEFKTEMKAAKLPQPALRPASSADLTKPILPHVKEAWLANDPKAPEVKDGSAS